MTRSATVSDAASLTELWRAAGLRFHPELTGRELASALRPGLVLVEEDAAGEITGAVFGTFDGVRYGAGMRCAGEPGAAANSIMRPS